MIELYEKGSPVAERIRLLKAPCNSKGKIDEQRIEELLALRRARPRSPRPSHWMPKRIQEDGAPGHGRSSAHSENQSSVSPNALKAAFEFRESELLKQPKFSPCTNVLDICVWRSLKSRMDAHVAEIPLVRGDNFGEVEAALWKVVRHVALEMPARVFSMPGCNVKRIFQAFFAQKAMNSASKSILAFEKNMERGSKNGEHVRVYTFYNYFDHFARPLHARVACFLLAMNGVRLLRDGERGSSPLGGCFSLSIIIKVIPIGLPAFASDSCPSPNSTGRFTMTSSCCCCCCCDALVALPMLLYDNPV